MRNLEKPLYDVRAYYIECLNGVRDTKLKERLLRCIDNVEHAASNYAQKAQQHKLFEVVNFYQNTSTDSLESKEEFKKLYENQVAKKGRPGRKVYDALILLPRNKECPFCSVGRVKNLDHFLPKAFFPIFSVVPINLVPSCRDCNQDKNADFPTTLHEQTLHPYFDDVSEVQWLYAKVIETIPPVIDYFTNESAIELNELQLKVNCHFNAYKLGDIFSDKAAEELSNIDDECRRLLESGGENYLKQYFLDKKYSYAKNYKNSWQVAMYGALSESSWFCNGGFIGNVDIKKEESNKEIEGVVCDYCKGEMTIDCPDCKYKKPKDCSKCSGTGIVEASNCPECKGYGHLSLEE